MSDEFEKIRAKFDREKAAAANRLQHRDNLNGKNQSSQFQDFAKENNPEYLSFSDSQKQFEKEIATAEKMGRVQGVCECVSIVGNYNINLGKKLLTEMNVTKDMAKQYAHPETYKTLEQGIFAKTQKIERTQGRSL